MISCSTLESKRTLHIANERTPVARPLISSFVQMLDGHMQGIAEIKAVKTVTNQPLRVLHDPSFLLFK